MPDDPQAESVPAVGAVVVDRDGRVLVVRRARPPGVGDWSLPGGRVEPGEAMEEAAVREVLEETALRARVVCPLGVVVVEREGFAFAIHEYLLAPFDDAPEHGGDARMEPVAGDDASEARWVGRDDLALLGVRQDAIAVVDRGLSQARDRAQGAT